MTVTVVDCVAVPPVPVQTRVYVVVTVGETDCVPDIALVPVHPPLAMQEVALVDDQVNVEALPLVIEAGEAEIETVGDVGGGVVAPENPMGPAFETFN